MQMLVLIQVISILFFSSLGAPLSFSSTAQNLSQIESNWQETRKYYDSNNFEEALELLQSHPSESSEYYYDVGTLFYKLGRLGPSLGYLEKANHLRPHDADIQHNLSVVRNSVSQKAGLENLDPASSTLEQISDQISLNEVRNSVGLAAILMGLLFFQSYLASRHNKGTLFNLYGLFGLSCFLVTLSIYGIHRFVDHSPPAILLETQVVRSGPGEHFSELARIEEGIKIRLLGSSGVMNPSSSMTTSQEVWRQIRYSPEGIGWVRASSLLNI